MHRLYNNNADEIQTPERSDRRMGKCELVLTKNVLNMGRQNIWGGREVNKNKKLVMGKKNEQK
jgi:hypothetical protein